MDHVALKPRTPRPLRPGLHPLRVPAHLPRCRAAPAERLET